MIEAELAPRPRENVTFGDSPVVSLMGQIDGLSTNTVLETSDLTKRFGDSTVVDSLTFSMNAGEVIGFLGPNGAGKSTTVGMILGLIRPTRGTVTIDGRNVAEHPEVVSQKVGAIIENPAFYPYLTGRQNIRALAMMSGRTTEDRLEYLLKLVNMDDRADQPYKTFSLGMKQRLGLAATLLTSPAIVILDEPTNGLDPAGQREIRSIIPRLAEEGQSVFLASHLLNEVEQVASRVAIIQKGVLRATGTVSNLLSGESYIEVIVSPQEMHPATQVLRSTPLIERVDVEDGTLKVYAPVDAGGDVNRTLAEKGIYASKIGPKQRSLEDFFLGLTEADEQPTA